MKRTVLISLVFLIFTHANGCINYYYGIDSRGHLHETSDFSEKFNINFDLRHHVNLLHKLEQKLKKQHHYMLLSDYAVGLMKLGKYKEALFILLELYNYYPEDYKLAANLGTAYELNGDPASALTYIRRGMSLNPDEHDGSEWVHTRILETKLAIQKDPAYLQNHTVLQLSPERKKNEDVCKHILLQVRERFPFSPGPDPIMASLLVDLGDCYAGLYSIEYARAVYEIAREYYGDHSSELLNRIAGMKVLKTKYQNVKPENNGENDGISNNIFLGNYKSLLRNNQDKPYQVDWSMINTDTLALLAMANLSLTSRQSRHLALSQADSSGLVLLRDDSITTLSVQDAPPAKPQRTGSPWYSWMISIPAALVVVWLIVRAMKKDTEDRAIDQ